MAQNRTAALRIVFGADTRQLNKALNDLSTKLTTVGRGLKSAGQTMSRSLTAPLAAIGAISIKTASDFEFAMAKVQAVSGFTAGEMEMLSDSARDFGARTAFSASQVAELQKELAKLGFSSSEIVDLTDGTLSLAQAFDMELGDAAEKVALNLNRFGLEAAEAGRVADVMAKAFGSSALDAERLNESLKMVAPVAKQSNFSLEQTTAILGALANRGLSGSMAGVGLQKVFVTLAKEGKNVKDGFAELLTESLTTEEAFERFGDRAGKLIPILQESAGEIALLEDKLYGAEGAAAAARAAMEDTTQGALKRMASGLEAAGIAVGTALLPMFKKLVDFVIKLADKFNNLAPAQQKIILALAGIAAAIGPLLMVSGSLVTAFGAVSGAAASLGLSLTAALGPIGVVVGLVAGGLALAYNQAGKEAAELKARQEELNKAVEGFPAPVRDAQKKVLDLQRELGVLEERLSGNTAAGAANFGDILDPGLQAELQAYRNELLATARETEELRKQTLRNEGVSLRASANIARNETYTFVNERLASYVRGLIIQQQAEAETQQAIYDTAVAEAERVAAVTEAKTALDEFQDTQNALKDAGEGLAMSQENYLVGLKTKWEEYAKAQVLAGQDSQAAQAQIKALNEEIAALGNIVTETTSKINFGNDFDKVGQRLAEQVNQIEGAFSVTDDQQKRLEGLAKAYRDAAIAAATLGDVALAEQFKAEADAYKQQATQVANSKKNTEALRESLFKLGYTASDVAGLSITELLQLLYKYENAAGTAEDATKQLDASYLSFANQIRDAVLGGIDAFATGLGQAVEQAKAAGEKVKGVGAVLKGAFAGVLDTLGSLLLQVGKQALLLGGTLKAIKESLKTLNPAVVIAAGIALIAAAGAIRGGLARSAEEAGGGIPALARGGITTGETLALVGDNPSGKEAIIPFERMGQFLSMVGADQQSVVVNGRLSGVDLRISNERAALARRRSTGL